MTRDTPPLRASLALTSPAGEYRIAAVEQAILKKFGPKMPFSQILKARQGRVTALQLLCRKHRMPVPTISASSLEIPTDWQSALRAEANLLLDNIRLYDRLMETPSPHPDVQRALWSMRQETLKIHLPLLFERNPPPAI